MVKNTKIKLLSIMICMLVLFNVTSIAESATIKRTQKGIATFDDDVPTWNDGDSWTYTIDDFTVDYNANGQKIFIDGKIDDFRLRVADTNEGSYKVDFEGKLTAEYEIYLSSSSMTLYVTGTFKPKLTRLTGTVIFSKSDLEIEDVSGEIKGITLGIFSPIPIPLPLPFKLTMNSELSTSFPLFDFPLHSNRFWDLPTMDVKMNTNIGGLFEIIKIPISFTTHYSWTPLAFHCKSKKDITVEAGSFSTWEISSLFGNFFEYYYVPSIGNLIKVDAVLPNGDIQGELKSTNRV